MFRLIIDAPTIQDKVSSMAQTLDNDYKDRSLALIGILSGGAYFLVDLSRELKIPHSVHFIKATGGLIQGLLLTDLIVIQNKELLLVDEMLDEGLNLALVKKYLIEEIQIDSSRIRTCVAFRKDKPNQISQPDYCCFNNLPNIRYVGYGIDYEDGSKRNLKGLYAIN